ncbi:MAG TPA: LuxR C-terminal-related transcriptional regulator [Euzebyales bacterium]
MVDMLERGREAFRRREWEVAYAQLSAVDAEDALAPGDLDRLARAAYLTGRDAECEDAWARAHQGFVDRNEVEQAVRCAYWLGLVLFNRGEEARGGGWIGRAGRLVAEIGRDCVEQGYLLLPAGLGRLGAGEPAEAVALFDRALDAADRFDEPDLRALGRLGAAQALIALDEPDRAVRSLDEAMVAVETGEVERAARCAFRLGFMLINRGEEVRGGGWIARADRLVADGARDCVEQGYLLLPAALARLGAGDATAAYELFGRALDVAERFDEPDLRALGRLGSGQALIGMHQPDRAVRSLDEAMVAVETGEVSTVVAGIVYCGVILQCQRLLDVRRAQQWTKALSAWCDAQPDLVPYRGQCLVHRSELAQMRGDWATAIAQAQRACARLADPPGQPAIGMAYYQRAELHRLRGEFADAERTYRLASRAGRGPHPGLALLRLAQGRLDDASGAIRRVVEEAQELGQRAKVLAACVDIMLATGDVDAARTAVDELSQIAAELDKPLLWAMSAQADGAVRLAEDEPRTAVAALHSAQSFWHELRAPYEVARVRVLLAAACRQLGDDDTARMEEEAAREVLTEVGARPDLARLGERTGGGWAEGAAGLTAREVEVIRLVAAGLTNREIADELVISEKTVARHLNNMFTKLGLSNRAAATAYAYKHELV